MKAIHRPLFPLGLAAVLAVPALAIEPPDDNSPPPAMPAGEPPAAPAKAEPQAQAPAAAYLGIGTAPVPDALAAHLELKAGEGVIIRALDPDGPAAKAGLMEHDIVTRIGGEPVGSHEELAGEIQKHQPGGELAVDYIHQGKPATKSLTLTARPDGMAAGPAADRFQGALEGMPEDQAQRIRKAIERQLRAFGDGDNPLFKNPAGADLDKAMEEMQKRMDDAFKGNPGGGLKIQGGATLRLMDGDGSIEFKSNDGAKEATVRDKGGKVTWSGPWDTEQDKAAAPPEVRARLDKLNLDEKFKGQGLRFRFGNQGMLDPDPAGQDEAEDDPKPDAEKPAPAAPESGPIK